VAEGSAGQVYFGTAQMPEVLQSMPESVPPRAFSSHPSALRIAVPGSPYQFKNVDRYSSHSVILSLLQSPGNRSVLDVGAAHGYLAAVLRQRGYRVTGIEGNPDLAREAAAFCDDVVVADLDGPLPEFNEQFDVILYGDVLEHLKSPKDVLVSLNQNLKPEGIIIVSLPNIANVYLRLHLLMGKFDYQDRGILDRTHLRFFTRKTFQEFLNEAGLEVLSMTASPVPLPLIVPKRFHGKILGALHAFNAWIARKWATMFGYQFIAVARRRGVA
jgi:2-polyprenyl-3-methyl-5-hydroxy-6-metoxy-1,4-benzoquinol methylase